MTTQPCPTPERINLSESADILVLDDEPSIAELLGEMVQLLGHHPTVSYLPERALEILRTRDFSVIISDFRMPGMNGQQFYEAVSLIKPELARKVVFLTGDVVNPSTAEFLKNVGNRHLSKPFQLKHVEALLGRTSPKPRFALD